jgi:hypothetical protein
VLARLPAEESQISLPALRPAKFKSDYPDCIALECEEGLQSGRNTPQHHCPEWHLGRPAGHADRRQGHQAEEAE